MQGSSLLAQHGAGGKGSRGASSSPALVCAAATVREDGLSPDIAILASVLHLVQKLHSLPRKELILAFQCRVQSAEGDIWD